MNLNSLLARLIRLVSAAGIGSFAFIGLFLFFSLSIRHLQAASLTQPLVASCPNPADVITSTKDMWIDESAVNQNHGTADTLHTKPNTSDLSRAFIQFDLSSIPTGSTINCAMLRVYERDSNNNQTIHLHRVTKSWNELEATWLNRKTGTPWTTAGGDYDPTEIASFAANVNGAYQDIDVTSLVQYWVDNPGSNFGTMLRSTTTGSTVVIQFDSREASNHPQLIIDYGKRPKLSISKTGSPAYVPPGDTIIYTIVVSNDGNDEAVGVVISDDLPANTTFVNNSITLDPPSAGTIGTGPPLLAGNLIISPGQQITITFAVTVNPSTAPGTKIVNNVEMFGADIITPTATFTSVVTGLFNPVLFVSKNGPVIASTGDVVTFTYRLLNLNIGDSSPINNLTVSDSIAGMATFVFGDFNGTHNLEVSEVWLYVATYTIRAGDPNPLVNVVTAEGWDQEYEIVRATDTFTTTIKRPPVFIPIILKPS